MKRWMYLTGILLLTAFLMAGCVGKMVEDRNLRIGLMPDIGMLPLLVAEEEGYFADKKLSTEFLVFKSARDRDAALQGGQLNGAMSDLLAAYFFIDSGFKIKAVAITESRFLLLGARNSEVESAADLNEVEIGISSNTVIEYFVDIVLEEEGVINKRKTSVPQVPVRMELLRSGQLKAASMPDPLATVVTKAGAVILADSRDMRLDPAVLIFTEKTVQEQKETLKTFFQAYNKAVSAINADPEKYRHLLLEKGQFPEDVISDIEIPHFRKASIPSPEEVERIMNWAQEKEPLRRELKYDDIVSKGLF